MVLCLNFLQQNQNHPRRLPLVVLLLLFIFVSQTHDVHGSKQREGVFPQASSESDFFDERDERVRSVPVQTNETTTLHRDDEGEEFLPFDDGSANMGENTTGQQQQQEKEGMMMNGENSDIFELRNASSSLILNSLAAPSLPPSASSSIAPRPTASTSSTQQQQKETPKNGRQQQIGGAKRRTEEVAARSKFYKKPVIHEWDSNEIKTIKQLRGAVKSVPPGFEEASSRNMQIRKNGSEKANKEDVDGTTGMTPTKYLLNKTYLESILEARSHGRFCSWRSLNVALLIWSIGATLAWLILVSARLVRRLKSRSRGDRPSSRPQRARRRPPSFSLKVRGGDGFWAYLPSRRSMPPMMDSLIARALARKPLKPGRNLVAFLTTTTDQQRTAFDGGPSSSPSSRVLPKTTPVQGVVNNDDCINSMGTTVPAGGVAANVTGEQQQKQSIKPLVFFT